MCVCVCLILECPEPQNISGFVFPLQTLNWRTQHSALPRGMPCIFRHCRELQGFQSRRGEREHWRGREGEERRGEKRERHRSGSGSCSDMTSTFLRLVRAARPSATQPISCSLLLLVAETSQTPRQSRTLEIHTCTHTLTHALYSHTLAHKTVAKKVCVRGCTCMQT